MSIWGAQAFENDDAADWLTDLEEDPNLDTIDEALREIADPGSIGYIEVPECAEAIAAAQTLTELFGAPGQNPVVDEDTVQVLSSELHALKPRQQKELVQRAVIAVQFVMNDVDNSELRQLWDDEPERAPEWLAAMSDLERRLQAIAARLR